MTRRVLPPEEFHRLVGTEAEAVIPHLVELHASPLVVEDDGVIVGCWVLFPMWHAECLWIAETHRGKSSVGRQLLRGLREIATALGLDRIWTAALSDDVRGLLTTYGAEQMPGTHHVMRVR